MVYDFFVDWWVSIMDYFASIFPEDDPFDVAKDGANWELFTTMNYFLPVSELLGVFASIFLLGGPMLIVTMIMWVAFGIVRGGSPRA